MTQLEDSIRVLGLEAEISLLGRWAKFHVGASALYVVEANWGGGYYTWCDHPQERSVEHFIDPVEAIRAGLRRATTLPATPEEDSSGSSR